MVKVQNFGMSAGDAKDLDFTVTDQDAVKLDLTSAPIKWKVARDPYSSVLLSKSSTDITEITSTDLPNGIFTVFLKEADTLGLDGVFYHEAEIRDANDDPFTITKGHITLTRTLI